MTITTTHKPYQILEGFLYYFEAARAKALLRAIRSHSAPGSRLLADHINDFTLASLKVRVIVQTKSSLCGCGCLRLLT